MTSEWGGGRRMSELESTMWRANRHPENSTQGAVLQILRGEPSVEETRGWHRYWLARFPRFTQRVAEPAVNTGPPVWVDDEHFDIDYHTRHIALPPGSTRQDLLTLCQSIAATPLDPARPPWTGTFITGLENGWSAYLLIVNHTLMDGYGSVALFDGMHDVSPGEVLADTASLPTPQPAPSGARIAVEQVADQVRALPGLLGRGAATLAQAALHPKEAVSFVCSVGRVLAQPPPSDSPLLRSTPRRTWRYGTLTCELADLKAAGKAVGGTVNDAYVCAILGGVRRYHEQSGWRLDDVTINMPVSMRRADDPDGANRFVTAFLRAPASVVDPAKRMQVFREAVAAKSAEPALDFFSLVLPFVNRAPSAVVGPLFTTMQNRVDLTVSNVPGPREETRLLGHVLDGIYYFGPLPGSPVMVVLCTMNGTCHIATNCDGDVFDPSQLMECLRAGLDEILALAHQGP